MKRWYLDVMIPITKIFVIFVYNESCHENCMVTSVSQVQEKKTLFCVDYQPDYAKQIHKKSSSQEPC